MSKAKIQTIVMDANGYPALNRLEIVCNALKSQIGSTDDKDIEEEPKTAKNGSQTAKKANASRYALKLMLYKAMKEIPQVDTTIGLSLTKEQLLDVFSQFIDLFVWLDENGSIFPITPTKQLFSAFAGISDSTYNSLLKNGDTEQKEAIGIIDNFIVDMQLESSGAGLTKEATTKFRLQAKGIGHSVVSASSVDGFMEKATEMLSTNDYKKTLNLILAGQEIKNQNN